MSGGQRSGRPTKSAYLHLFGAAAFAVAPIFDVLGRNVTFFVAHHATALQIVAFALLTSFGLAIVAGVIEWVISRISLTASRAFHRVALALLVGLTFAVPGERIAGTVGWLVGFALGIALIVLTYRQGSITYRALTWLSPATLVFPALFLFASPVRSSVISGGSLAGSAVEANGTSVALLLLDELPLGTLVTPDGDIDEDRFPNIARMSAMSTWYPNVSTNAETTHKAVPALLTGNVALEYEAPDFAGYPQNLFTMLGSSYDLHVNQTITELCPREYCPDQEAGSTSALFSDARTVALHVLLPGPLAKAVLPDLGAQWGGFGRDQVSGIQHKRQVNRALRSRLGELGAPPVGPRTEGFENLLDTIAAADDQLWYSHVSVPHRPWEFLPDGRSYTGASFEPGVVNQPRGPQIWSDDAHAIDHGLQRHLLQARFGDRLVGRFLDRLESTDALDDTLVIVAADHGVSFIPGTNVRELDDDNPGEILPVPLFIKYPGESKAKIDDRHSQLVDVLPTIADVLDTDVPWRTAGVSLRRPEHARPRRVARVPVGFETYPPGVVDGRFRIAEHIRDVFGPRNDADDLYDFDSGLVGRDVGAVDATALEADIVDADDFAKVDTDADVVPVYVRGAVSVQRGQRLAVALNGTIAGIGWADGERFAIMVSPRYLVDGRNDVAVYVV